MMDSHIEDSSPSLNIKLAFSLLYQVDEYTSNVG